MVRDIRDSENSFQYVSHKKKSRGASLCLPTFLHLPLLKNHHMKVIISRKQVKGYCKK